jgi:hypothetical protein
MRTLTWYLSSVGPGTSQKETYRLDGPYNPVRAWVHSDVAPIVSELMVDINVDGVSIFSYQLRLQDDKDADSTDFNTTQFSKDSLVSLDIDQAGGNSQGVTVGLELEEA